MKKLCSKCRQKKDTKEFGKLSSSKDGLKYWCKNCNKKDAKTYQRGRKLLCHTPSHGTTKKCRICKKEKPIEDFPKDLVRKDGRDNRCRVCLRKRNNKYEKHKKQVDPEFRIMCVLRSRVRCAVRDQFTKRAYKTEELVGCSVAYLIGYLESQFDDKMTWDNYGKDGWHIDHIKPCAAFDLTKPEEQKKCFHYKNLQPLWWPDNIRKRSWYKGKLYLNKP